MVVVLLVVLLLLLLVACYVAIIIIGIITTIIIGSGVRDARAAAARGVPERQLHGGVHQGHYTNNSVIVTISSSTRKVV